MNLNPNYKWNTGLFWLKFDRLKFRKLYNDLVSRTRAIQIQLDYIHNQLELGVENEYRLINQEYRLRAILSLFNQEISLIEEYFENLSKC